MHPHKNRCIDQNNETNCSELNPHICGLLIFKRVTRINNGQMVVAHINGVLKTGEPHVKE